MHMHACTWSVIFFCCTICVEQFLLQTLVIKYIFHVISEISPLQAVLLIVCVCMRACVCAFACVRVCASMCVRVCACVCEYKSVSTMLWFWVLCFVMGYVLQFGEMAHKRINTLLLEDKDRFYILSHTMSTVIRSLLRY